MKDTPGLYLGMNIITPIIIYLLIANGIIPIPDSNTIFIKKTGLEIQAIRIIYQNETNFTSPELLINVKVLNNNNVKPSNTVAVHASCYILQEKGRIYINKGRSIFEEVFPVGEKNVTFPVKIGTARPDTDKIVVIVYLEVNTDLGPYIIEKREVIVNGKGPWVFK